MADFDSSFSIMTNDHRDHRDRDSPSGFPEAPPTPLFRGGVAGAVLVGGRAVCCCVWEGCDFSVIFFALVFVDRNVDVVSLHR